MWTVVLPEKQGVKGGFPVGGSGKETGLDCNAGLTVFSWMGKEATDVGFGDDGVVGTGGGKIPPGGTDGTVKGRTRKLLLS